MTRPLLSRLALVGLFAIGALSASAQIASTNNKAVSSTSTDTSSGASKEEKAYTLDTFVVNGLRASLASAADIKESNQQIVDSIVANDIDKLPDVNVSYALSRIPGIQVAHTFAGLGGNGAVTIHGLTQVANTLDGREVFTPGGASGGGIANGQRTFDYSQVPSSLIAGIDVYKTSAANQIDGGLGGLIDVRLHKPLDFGSGVIAGATFGTTYSVLDSRVDPNYNLFVSDTFKTSVGKIGVLISGSYNVTPWREDNIGIGNPASSATVSTGNPGALVATAYNVAASWGQFRTIGYNAMVQWQPHDNLSFYAGVNHNQWANIEDQVSMLIGLPVSTAVAGSGTMFSGSSTAVQSATFANVTGTSYSVIRDLKDMSTMIYAGGDWTSGDLKVKFDANHFNASYGFYNNGVYASAAIPRLTFDLGGNVPSAYVTGASLMDQSIYKPVQVINRLYPSSGEANAAKVDLEFNLKAGVFTKLLAGVRYGETEQDNKNLGLYLGAYNIPSGSTLSSFPGVFSASPIQNFFDGYKQVQPQQYISAPYFGTFRDPAALLKLFGDTTTTPSTDGTINPLSFFKIKETTSALYLMPKFEGKIASLPFDGNIGLRVVQTQENLSGNQTVTPASVSSTGVAVIGPINIKSKYVDSLPSFNSRLKLTDRIYLRVSASKTITRPPFSSMSPSLTLNQNPINAAANSGSQGNPNLKPIRSTNYDISIEDYINKDSVIYVAAFYKDVKGFIASITDPQTYNGVTYQISTSANLNPATIKGGEIGYHQFFTFLPAPFDGLGLQANYTLVESTTPSTIQGYNIPLTNLSKTSYNVVAMYEKGPFSARVAYNWRDQFVTGVSNFVGVGLLQQVVRAYGDLDASLNYNITKNIQLSVQAINLNNALRYQYWGSPEFPSNVYTDGRTFMANISYRF